MPFGSVGAAASVTAGTRIATGVGERGRGMPSVTRSLRAELASIADVEAGVAGASSELTSEGASIAGSEPSVTELSASRASSGTLLTGGEFTDGGVIPASAGLAAEAASIAWQEEDGDGLAFFEPGAGPFGPYGGRLINLLPGVTDEGNGDDSVGGNGQTPPPPVGGGGTVARPPECDEFSAPMWASASGTGCTKTKATREMDKDLNLLCAQRVLDRHNDMPKVFARCDGDCTIGENAGKVCLPRGRPISGRNRISTAYSSGEVAAQLRNCLYLKKVAEDSARKVLIAGSRDKPAAMAALAVAEDEVAECMARYAKMKARPCPGNKPELKATFSGVIDCGCKCVSVLA